MFKHRTLVTVIASIASLVSVVSLGVIDLTHTTRTVTRNVTSLQSCLPNDYFMQCAAGAPGQTVAPFRGVTHTLFGVDFAWGGPPASVAAANGAHFGASYLSDSSKDWSYGLVHAYVHDRLGAVFVWETAAAEALNGYGAGASDARNAQAELNRDGFPHAPVYFAADFDTSGYGCGSLCPYWRGVNSVLGVARTGAYGGLNTMRILFAAGLIHYGWQTLAWSFGVWDSRAQLRQTGINWTWHGFSVDPDFALTADYGQANFAPPAPSVNHHYDRFINSQFRTPPWWGDRQHRDLPKVVNERTTVRLFDRLNVKPWTNRVRLHVVRQELLFLRRRLWFLVHADHPCVSVGTCGTVNWRFAHRGYRFAVEYRDSRGVKPVRP